MNDKLKKRRVSASRMAEIFRMIPKFLAMIDHEYGMPGKSRYCCVAADTLCGRGLITYPERSAIADVIDEQLGEESTLEGWLIEQGVPPEAVFPRRGQDLNPKVQQHRVQWMHRIAEGFDAQAKKEKANG